MYDMPDSQLAWIVDMDSRILCFEGKDLTGIYTVNTNHAPVDVAFATETHGIVAVSDAAGVGIHMTVDGGQTWTSVQEVVGEPGWTSMVPYRVGAFTSGVSVFDAFRAGLNWSEEADEGPNQTGGVLLEYTGMPIVPQPLTPQPQIRRPFGN
jgi:photosystem II stability/assembly factor-like uncharacterized protein